MTASKLTPCLLTSLLFVAGPALADDHVSVLVGTNTAFDGDPASLRLSVRPEFGLSAGPMASASLLVPITLTTWGDDGVGFSTSQSLVEVPVSVRGRLFHDKPLRLYGDLGAGVAIGTSRFDGWFVNSTDQSAAFMTRTAVGLEVGNPDALSFVVEPASWTTYAADDAVRARWGMMLGLSAAL